MSRIPSWLCGRCLAVLNASSAIVAQHRTHANVLEPFPDSPTSMGRLRTWAEDKLLSGEWNISLDDMARAFDPVATWHGDPVCETHLRSAVEREITGRWR